MPKSAKTSKSTKSSKTTKATKPKIKKQAPDQSPRSQPGWTPEYQDYLERYREFGEGRPRLSAEDFDKLDDELLELLDLSADGQELSDDQVIRINELEYLLIDSE